MSPLVTGLAKGFGFSKIPLSTGDVRFNYEYWIAKLTGLSSSSYNYNVTTDSNGNVIFGGYLVDGSDYRVFIVKYDNKGNLLWQKKYTTGASFNSIKSLSCDSSGNIYFATSTTFSFYKIDPNGNIVWGKAFDASGTRSCQDVAVDSSDNVYVVGYSGAYGQFPEGNLIKLDTSGTVQWQVKSTLNAYQNVFFNSVTTDSSGNIYVAGNYDNTALFIQKFNSSGTLLFTDVRQINRTISGMHIAVSSTTGNIYVAISYFVSSGDYQIYTIQYNSSGTYQRIASLDRGLGQDLVGEISVDSSGNVYVSGEDSGAQSIFAKYNSNLALQWVRYLSGGSREVTIHIDNNDDMWVSTGAYILAKLPNDGSLTGNYGGITYGVPTLNTGSPNFSSSTYSLSSNSTSYTTSSAVVLTPVDTAGTSTTTEVS